MLDFMDTCVEYVFYLFSHTLLLGKIYRSFDIDSGMYISFESISAN